MIITPIFNLNLYLLYISLPTKKSVEWLTDRVAAITDLLHTTIGGVYGSDIGVGPITYWVVLIMN